MVVLTCPSRRLSPFAILRVTLPLTVLCILVVTAWLGHLSPQSLWPVALPHQPPPASQPLPGAALRKHPIDHLMREAESAWHRVMAKETMELAPAASAYRERRGRHPPPGFAQWFQFAQDHDAVVVEDFFDQIYHDLNPFWGVEAKRIRRHAKAFDHVISVRNGNTTYKSDDVERPWRYLWWNLTATMQNWLPDVDIPINVMDESRVLAPWEVINQYMQAEQESRRIIDRADVVTGYTGLKDVDDEGAVPFDPQWIHTGVPYWDVARVGCAPDTPSRHVGAATDFSGPPPTFPGFLEQCYHGYVANWTEAKDPCLDPVLRESHGTFVEPLSISTSQMLFPLFGGSKLPMNNEILLPPAMYWTSDPFYAGDAHNVPWDQKQSKLMWRGAATGGRNRRENWTRFQRHRFVSMVNGTAVRRAERNPYGAGFGPNFSLQGHQAYLRDGQQLDLGTWLDDVADAAFVHLVCFPATGDVHCPYTDSFFQVKDMMPMSGEFAFKYLPDVDGNSFSGRYRSFLRSTSLPIKATVYQEWHDSRLMPWLHFVPMHNSFIDIYGILDYFVGGSGHDKQAERIAMAGKEWAERVLRQDDMLAYVMRLLMEFARICDDQRELLGFVGDLEADGSGGE